MLAPETAQYARRIHLRTRRLVDGIFAGQYHSVFKGSGIEFAEVREYVPGDDVRTIDWNITARLGHPYVKRYVEERELTVMLLVDLSASGRFGSVRRQKAEVLIELAALLATSAIRNNDKVGLLLFTDRIEHFLPAQKGKNRALRVIGELLAFAPEGRGTDLGMALEYLHKVVRGRSLTFVLSDFMAQGYERALRLVHRRHEIVPISIADPREQTLPRVGLLALHDLETGREVVVDTSSRRVVRDYERQREASVAARRGLFRSLGIDAVEVDTAEPYIHPLMRFFRVREKRLREGR